MASLVARMSNMFDPTMMMDASDPMFATQISEFIQGCAGFAAGATVAVMLRLFTRWHQSTKMSHDDIAIALSLLPMWVLAAIGIQSELNIFESIGCNHLINGLVALHGGLAKKVHSLTREEEAVYYPSVFVASILYALAITAAKLSILLLYRRIFTGTRFRRILNFFMVTCVLWCVAVTLLAIFRCNPIRTSWSTHRTIHRLPHQCIPLTKVYYGTSITNLILDVIVNLLPVRQIWTLQLPRRQKVLLTLCLSLGIVSIAAGVGRVLTIPPLDFSELPGAIAPTETIAMPYLFLIVENSFAIICACLPTYYPLIMWSARRVGNSKVGSRVKSLVSSNSGSVSSTKERTLTSASALSSKWSRRDRNSRFSLAFLGWKSDRPKGPRNTLTEPTEVNDRLGLIGTTSTKVIPGSSPKREGEGIVISQSWSTSTSHMRDLELSEKKGESWIFSDEVSEDKI